MARRLTDRQTAALAAVERLGAPTIEPLRRELGIRPTSQLVRALDALVERGLIYARGDRSLVYVDGVYWTARPDGATASELTTIADRLRGHADDIERT